MTRTYVFTQMEGSGEWNQRTSYTYHPEQVREQMHKLIRQDYEQAGKDAVPRRVMLVTVESDRPAETRMVEYTVKMVEPTLVRLAP